MSVVKYDQLVVGNTYKINNSSTGKLKRIDFGYGVFVCVVVGVCFEVRLHDSKFIEIN